MSDKAHESDQVRDHTRSDDVKRENIDNCCSHCLLPLADGNHLVFVLALDDPSAWDAVGMTIRSGL